ncbi:hypothetical protein Dsin_032129 [Dipteronia sinensis]|uniref:Reverse transcriptase domain-containing protein n=1 Tax=Dipteronia sinensis TaxID=43782 RepID=A0AAD9ZN84_9ROSI|nr:hypothetical protein Dsin_032129 [Dipteronia sinensis]
MEELFKNDIKHLEELSENDILKNCLTMINLSRPVSYGIGTTLSNIIDKVISNGQADFMGRDVTDDEIREVCFSLHPNKAPGLDGFNAHFFNITWDIVGEDVISVVQEFFMSGLLLKELNATILALVPKVPNPSKMKDFRPISCCNTLYKIIAKIIANRIKPCLPNIISPSQSAFVAGRCIGDNILLVQELMRNYHKDASCPREAFAKGIPCPPYLFVIAMEVLSKILVKRIEDSPSFKFHWRCDKIKLSHLCFADDLIMLCHGSLSSARVVKAALDEFSLLSGLHANHAKSNIFTSGVSHTINQQLINHFGYTHYIGNGSSTSLWFGNWHPDGPLLSKWSPRVVYDLGLPIHATVSSIVHGDSWSWPAAMSIDLFEIRSRMPSYNPNSNVNDRACWLPSSNGTYSTSS